MKGLRIILIFALVAFLMAGSVGTVFAKGEPKANNPGKGLNLKVEKRGFAGNVTKVVGGNVTLDLNGGEPVNLLAGDTFWYKIPREINNWQRGNITDVIQAVDGTLIGRRAVVQAGNDTGDWVVLKFMVLPIPGTQPAHAHRTGLVIEKLGSATAGNITIKDIHGGNQTFAIATGTDYHPEGIGFVDINLGSFVTVVVAPKTKLPLAKAIVLHANIPEGWPTPAP